ncbi:MAG: hypothetical protein ACOY30_10475 [Bacillota bacterium]
MPAEVVHLPADPVRVGQVIGILYGNHISVYNCFFKVVPAINNLGVH